MALSTLFDASLLNLPRAAFGRLSFVWVGRLRAALFCVQRLENPQSCAGPPPADPLTSGAAGPKSGARELTLTKTEWDKSRFWRLYCSCRIEGRLVVRAAQFETMRVA